MASQPAVKPFGHVFEMQGVDAELGRIEVYVALDPGEECAHFSGKLAALPERRPAQTNSSAGGVVGGAVRPVWCV